MIHHPWIFLSVGYPLVLIRQRRSRSRSLVIGLPGWMMSRRSRSMLEMWRSVSRAFGTRTDEERRERVERIAWREEGVQWT